MKEMSKKSKGSVYDQGYKAFTQQQRPDACPLKDKAQALEWLRGWSDAFADFFGGF